MDNMGILGEHKVYGCVHNHKEVWWKGETCVCIVYEESHKAEWLQIYATIVVEVQEDGVGTPILQEITDLLGDFADRMSELPKVLPTRHIIDHCIELDLGLQPLTRAPYRLFGPELEELKRPMTKLIDVGVINPSRSPNGGSILFQKKKDTS
jgi:hypothetical protein